MEGYIRKYLLKIELGNDFLNTTQKGLTKRAKFNNIKLIICSSKDIIKRMKERQAIILGNVFVLHVTKISIWKKKWTNRNFF